MHDIYVYGNHSVPWYKMESESEINIYTPLQKYWNSEANSFIFAVDWIHLGLTSKDEYEMRD